MLQLPHRFMSGFADPLSYGAMASLHRESAQHHQTGCLSKLVKVWRDEIPSVYRRLGVNT